MKSTRIKRKPEDEFELKAYLLALRTKYEDLGSYEDQSIRLRIEFGIEVEPRDIWLLTEPNIQEEQLDRELVWKNQNLM